MSWYRVGNARLFTLVLCATTAFLLAETQWLCQPDHLIDRRFALHTQVLAHTAPLPYQEHMFLISHAIEALHEHGFPRDRGVTLFSGLGYFTALASTWALLEAFGASVGQLLLALAWVGLSAALAFPLSLDHPADPIGAGLFALGIALIQAGRPRSYVALALTAGFLWRKHVVLGPIVFLYALLTRAPGTAATAVAGSLAALVGPAVYHATISAHSTIPGVFQGGEKTVQAVWIGLYFHLPFVAPALFTIVMERRRVPPLIALAALAYPIQLGLYLVQNFNFYELRSFWPSIPVFAVIVSSWARD